MKKEKRKKKKEKGKSEKAKQKKKEKQLEKRKKAGPTENTKKKKKIADPRFVESTFSETRHSPGLADSSQKRPSIPSLNTTTIPYEP